MKHPGQHIGLMLACWGAGGILAASAVQPTALVALHRSGQTFLTWTERSDQTGEYYAIYRHTEPITVQNLDQAIRLYTVPEDSSRFYANRYNFYSLGLWKVRYVERYVIEDNGAALSEGTGLLVWTPATNEFSGGTTGQAYYAVTTIDALGTEDRDSMTSANSIGPVAEGVADPLPVEAGIDIGERGHVYIQYMDLRHWNPTFHAPNAANLYYGLSSANPAVSNAVQYAYDYVVFEPETADSPAPAYLKLHGWGGNSYGPEDGDPELNGWGAYKIYPVDVGETWYFGFARDHDYRLNLSVTSGDVIVNYTEQRLLRMVYDLARHPPGPPVDLNRVYVYGHSMGGTGALAFALRYPHVFAAAYACQPMTEYRTSQVGGGVVWRVDAAIKWGNVALNLPVELEGPAGCAASLRKYNGTGVWNWQSHQTNLLTRVADDMVPFGIAHGLADTLIEFSTQGQPVYPILNASKQAWGGMVTADEHDWLDFQGMPPTLAPDAHAAPFKNFQVVLNETVPGLGNGSADLDLPPTGTGGYHLLIDWSASWNAWDGPPLDTARRWQLSLRSLNGADQTVDVTPRRLQVFSVSPGLRLTWQNIPVGGVEAIQRGTVMADANGLVTVTGMVVSASGNRLSIERLGVVKNDFDGDGKTDRALYAESNGLWQVRFSSGTATTSTVFGGVGHQPVSGDFDGDAKSDMAIYEQTSGRWQVLLSGSGMALASTIFGGPGYEPVSGDFDGDGKTDPAVYKESDGTWGVMLSAASYEIASVGFGGVGYCPIPGDYDGDGKADPAVMEESGNQWHVLLSASGYAMASATLGASGATPVSGDYDGDLKADLMVYRESDGAWLAMLSASAYASASLSLGGVGLSAVSGDFDGDGKTDPAVFNEATGLWTVALSGSGYTTVTY